MAVSGIKIPVNLQPTDLELLKNSKSDSVEAEKARLKQAAKDFESLFIYQMLKSMRKTIPDNPLSENSFMSGGMGEDTYTEMFDMELSKHVSGSQKGSIADMLYKQLSKQAFGEVDDIRDQSGFLKFNQDATRNFKLNDSQFQELPVKEPIEFENKTDFIPVARTQLNIKDSSQSDSILARYGRIIDSAAEANNLDSALVYAVIKNESNGNSTAVSPAGAKGLMQLMDGTAQDYGVEQVFDPKENINAGTRYLKDLYDRFGDLETALAAYNAGPGNVEKYGGIPPFKETEQYVKKVVDTLETVSNVNMMRNAKGQ